MSYHRTMLSFQTLQKLAASLEQTIQTSPDLARVTRQMLAHQAELGIPHVPAHDVAALAQKQGRVAVARDAGSGATKKLTVAEMLDSEVAPRGERVAHKVQGVDQNEYARNEFGVGPKQRRAESAHVRTFPGGFSQEQSFSSVKVAAAETPKLKSSAELRAKLRALKANKDSLDLYRPLILSEPLILDVPLDSLPEVPYPPNDSDVVAQELATIRDTMDMAPVPEDVMELADEEPLELFRRTCNDLKVPHDEDILPLIVSDLRRYAMSLKYVYRRPRPAEIAPYYDIAILPTDVDPYIGSPSYPSIHATIGYGVANYYAFMYPQHTDAFAQVADLIAMQRVQTGHHFPTDNSYAKIIADVLLPAQRTPAPVIDAQPAQEQEITFLPTEAAEAPDEQKTAARRIRVLRR